MKHLNTRLAVLGTLALGLATHVSAWDEYAPVSKGKMEVDLMASYNLSPSAGGFSPSLQVKYGFMEGLDVELSEALATDPEFGAGQPNLAVKYGHPSGFGGFVGVDLPVASEKVSADPATVLYVAAQYLKTFDKVLLSDWLLYSRSLESGAVGVVDLYVKPQYNVNDKVGPYLGLDFKADEKFDLYTITAKPGINYVINGTYSAEANVGIAKTKDVDDIAVAAYLGFYGVF
ncbi:MAG TPA: hypothetical protein PKO15_03000 [Fibrobacteria bacterium]|nr:hypothetical protein [Fibrobacteria bacterium]HOX51891.1 hypothetical protein [Fibrobacteria bacterium]